MNSNSERSSGLPYRSNSSEISYIKNVLIDLTS